MGGPQRVGLRIRCLVWLCICCDTTPNNMLYRYNMLLFGYFERAAFAQICKIV